MTPIPLHTNVQDPDIFDITRYKFWVRSIIALMITALDLLGRRIAGIANGRGGSQLNHPKLYVSEDKGFDSYLNCRGLVGLQKKS